MSGVLPKSATPEVPRQTVAHSEPKVHSRPLLFVGIVASVGLFALLAGGLGTLAWLFRSELLHPLGHGLAASADGGREATISELKKTYQEADWESLMRGSERLKDGLYWGEVTVSKAEPTTSAGTVISAMLTSRVFGCFVAEKASLQAAPGQVVLLFFKLEDCSGMNKLTYTFPRKGLLVGSVKYFLLTNKTRPIIEQEYNAEDKVYDLTLELRSKALEPARTLNAIDPSRPVYWYQCCLGYLSLVYGGEPEAVGQKIRAWNAEMAAQQPYWPPLALTVLGLCRWTMNAIDQKAWPDLDQIMLSYRLAILSQWSQHTERNGVALAELACSNMSVPQWEKQWQQGDSR